jgi:predicted metal-binding membrane protein
VQEVTVDEGTAIEAALKRDRLIVASGLAAVIGISWLYVVSASHDMYGRMNGLSAWMMAAGWDARYFLLIFLMWCVMMVGMMLPSAAPTILLFARLVRHSSPLEAPIARMHAFAGGYAVAWMAFSLAATALQRVLAEATLISPMMEASNPTFAGTILIAAGSYQWTPAKRICLTRCRSPLYWLSRHWRTGVLGAAHMGMSHGLHCVGCCWAVMLILFFGGVMNLLWIALIAAFVLVEKLSPYGTRAGQLAGVPLIGGGLWLLLR